MLQDLNQQTRPWDQELTVDWRALQVEICRPGAQVFMIGKIDTFDVEAAEQAGWSFVEWMLAGEGNAIRSN